MKHRAGKVMGILGRASTGYFVFNSVGNGKLMERFNQKLCPD